METITWKCDGPCGLEFAQDQLTCIMITGAGLPTGHFDLCAMCFMEIFNALPAIWQTLFDPYKPVG